MICLAPLCDQRFNQCFFLNFGVLVIFRQQHVVKRGVLRLQQCKICAEFACAELAKVLLRISKILAQNPRRRSLTKKFKDIKTVVGSGGFHHLRTAINVLGSVQSSV
jgi:hypothetical protein